jgi:hypothetical protein
MKILRGIKSCVGFSLKMPLKEYIEVRPIIKVSNKKHDFKYFVLDVISIIIKSIIPFVCGFYFVKSKNILFIIPIFFLIFFDIIVKGDKDV